MDDAQITRRAGRLAGLLLVGCGGLSAATLPLPQAESSDRSVVLLLSAVAVLLGAITYFAPWQRWHPRVSLVLLPIAFALISAGNYFGNAQPYTYSVYFIVAFVWLGLSHPRWTSIWFLAPAVLAYVVPFLFRPGSSRSALASVVLVVPVSAFVAEAIAWIGARERRSRERSSALARVALALGPHLDVESLSQTLANETLSMLRAERAVFFLLRDENIQRVYGAGFRPEILERLRGLEGFPIGDQPGMNDLREGMPVLVEDAINHPKLLRNPARFGLKSYMAVPVIAGGALAGILSCAERTRPRRYEPDDVVSAQALAAQVSSALNNALLYERTLDAARSDHLTQLENRRAFHERLDVEIERARRYERQLSLVLVDVDRLKTVNDGSGHAAGDHVLQHVADVLRAGSRREDGVYRLGGDEFALVLPETDAEGATTLAERLRIGVERSQIHTEAGRNVTVSIGVAAFPEHGINTDELFARADTAMYEVKRAGRNAVSTAMLAGDAGPGVRFGIDIAGVIDDRRLVARYQPVIRLADGLTLGYECYCRLDPAYGAAPTTTLFRAAGALGLTVRLDRNCRDQALGGLRDIDAEELVFLNVSSVALASEEFDVPDMLSSISRHELRPEQLVVEVTGHERAPAPRLVENLAACRAAGMAISLDDFGSGPADLDVATSLRFDFVKIDIGFVHGDGELRRQLVRGLLVVAGEIGAKSVAKSVETHDDLNMVRDLGFDAAQGYFLKDPSPRPERPRPLDLLPA